MSGAALDHLRLELRRLDLLIHREILRLRAAYQLSLDEFRGLYVSDAQVDALVAASAGGTTGGGPTGAAALTEAAARIDEACQPGRAGAVPFARLARGLGLSALERDLVLLALAPEIDAKYETLYAYLNNDVARRAPSVLLATRLFGGDAGGDPAGGGGLAVRAALMPDAPLIRDGVISYQPGERHALLSNAFAIHRALPAFCLGLGFGDGEALTRTPADPESSAGAVFAPGFVHRLAGVAAALQGPGRLAVLCGRDGAARARAVAVIAAHVGLDRLRVDLSALPQTPHDLRRGLHTALLAQRLEPALLHVAGVDRLADGGDRLPAEVTAALGRVRGAAGPVIVDGDTPARWSAVLDGGGRVTIPVPDLDGAGRRVAWAEALARAGRGAAPEAVASVADAFALTIAEIDWAAADLPPPAPQAVGNRAAATPLDAQALAAAARAISDRSVAGVSQRLDQQLGWPDLVLPAATFARLREIAGAIAQRRRVYGDWGFARRAGGFGLRVMLAGPSGTGKTMATGVIGRELGLDVYRVDIAQIVSKYIGETEKNLDRVFAAAEDTSAILFFDEADALFGKRSEVKDAHDRYGNIEVAYLLQRMEAYEGVLFLATNLTGNLDTAFSRRINFVVEFPLPDPEARARLWRAMIPGEAPLGTDVDFDFLAQQFPLTGGDIRNVVLDAAFLAAQNGQVIGMKELVVGLGRQIAKQGRVPNASEFRNYLPLVSGGPTEPPPAVS